MTKQYQVLTVRTAVKAGHPGENLNHNEALNVRSAVKAGGGTLQHNETLKVRVADIRRQVTTTTSKNDRLALMVVRAGLRAGGRRIRDAKRR